MNKSTFTPEKYVDALPLPAAEQAALRASTDTDFAGFQHQLGQDTAASSREDDAPLTSVSSRIEMAWPESLDDGKQFGKMTLIAPH
ncbi:Glucans biosynthesis glucosyltransferase H [Tatumella ptyseos]|uniref:Glucans biosynthesis glucosyltransferase H n=1 Tax=Tatumella ptyseos TaxID=82987 RepID=A0A2X5PLP5_9GAMM|nr:Glucans biosynthesis glucosyltransferase H [Tatumella ptyseos]